MLWYQKPFRSSSLSSSRGQVVLAAKGLGHLLRLETSYLGSKG